MSAKQFLQGCHALEITRQFRDRRPADVQLAVAIVVKFQREVRRLAGLYHSLQPLLQREILWGQLRGSRLIPVAVQVLSLEIESRPAQDHAILVRHRQNVGAVTLQKLPGIGVAFE
jgi:hypothetical protein